MQQLFFPGVPGEGDPVHPPQVLDALLLAPAYANGKKRVHLPKKVPQFHHLRDDATGEEQPEHEKTVHMQLPHHVMAHEADEIFPNHGVQPNGSQQVSGQDLANRITERIIGRPVKRTQPYWRDVHYASWTVTGLTPDEVYAVRAAVKPLSEIYYAQRTARRARRQARAPAAAWWRD